MLIKQLVYISRSIKLMTSADLLPLLEQSRHRNTAADITGMLLYKDRSFIQLLEGPEQAVDQLYSCIFADSRHLKVKTVVELRVAERSFSQWSMGFHHLDEQSIDLPKAYTYFMSAPNTDDIAIATKATELLNYFQKAS